MKPTVVALVPMRHDSKRVPGKNYRSFGGMPLFHHVIRSLLACPQIDQVVIDTDSDIVLDSAQRTFPQVLRLRRPEHLRADTIAMNDVLLHTTRRVSADIYLQTHSTNPLLSGETIQRAINAFLRCRPDHDSLFSVTRHQTRLWNASGQPINHDPERLLRTQDLPPVFEENSCLYLFTRPVLEQRRNRIGHRPLLFEIPRHEAIDIDEEIDFKLAEQMYLMQQAELHRAA